MDRCCFDRLVLAGGWLTNCIARWCARWARSGLVLIASKRIAGRFSEPVNLYKFRSMSAKYGKKDAADEFEEMGRPDLAEEYRKNHKVSNDPRITKFGKFLRSTSAPRFTSAIAGTPHYMPPELTSSHQIVCFSQ